MRTRRFWRILPAALLLLALLLPTVPVMAQDSGSVISIDAPNDGTSFQVGQDVVFRGWAANMLGPGTGVDRVIVLDAPQAAGGVTVAEASYGAPRPDVGQAYGAAWTNVGYTATWRAAGASGNRTFWVYAHSPGNDGWTNKTVTLRLAEAAAPAVPPPPPPPPTTTGPSTQTQNVSIVDFDFRPPTMNIRVGDTVTWTNNGQAPHTATSDRGSFDTGRLNPGQSGSYTFTTAGTYQYHCAIHPNMHGTIIVGGSTAGVPSYGQNYDQYGNRYRNPISGLYDDYYGGGYGNPYYGGGYGNPYGGYGNPYFYNGSFYGNGLFGNPIYQPYPGNVNCNPNFSGYPYSGYDVINNPLYCPNPYPITSGGSTTITATTSPSGSVSLIWQPVPGAVRYKVYETSPANVLLSTVTPPYPQAILTATVTGLAPNTSVTLEVRAVDQFNIETAIPATWRPS